VIHTTIRLYANGQYIINGVSSEHLEDHIEYNKTYRWGCSLFVDGKCVFNGYQSNKEIKRFETKIKGDSYSMQNKCTVPYS